MSQRFKSRDAPLTLGRHIAAARLAAGMSISDLAKKARVHHSSVTRAEQGYFQTINPSVRKICTELDVTWEEKQAAPDLAILLSQVERLATRSPGVAYAISALFSELEISLDA